MTIDTLSIARDLKAAELPPAQAEAIAAAIGRSIVEGSANKADVALSGQELKASIEQLRGDVKANVEQLRAEIERMRNQIFLGLFSSQIALAGIVLAFIKL